MEGKTITGIIYAIICSVFLGSTYLPLRRFDKSDGLYFQFVQSVGQLMIGVILTIFSTPSPVIPIAMINGVFYSLGNSLTMFIMEGIGMAVGYLLWNSMACLTGWAVTRFGWFFNEKQVPRHQFLNILGVLVIILGSALFTLIEHVPHVVRPAPWSIENGEKPEKKTPKTVQRKIISIILTLLVGFLYGNFISPINYIQTNYPGADRDVRAYFLSYCLGAFATSTVIFLIYSWVRGNVPKVNPELSLPSIVSGMMYGVGMFAFFTACQNLDPVIGYPILSKAPGIIVSLWAVFLFKEIQGRRSILQLYTGIAVTLTGITMIALSKADFS